MTRSTTASLAILGTAAIVLSMLASPAMAEGKMAKGAKTSDKSTEAPAKSTEAPAKPTKSAEAPAKQTLTTGKGQRHATVRSQRIRSANASLRRPAGPVEAAGNVAGGAVATAGAIATAPFRAFDNNNNYYGYGYGGRDWKTYAEHNKLACTPGTTFKGSDGKKHRCQ